MAVGLTPDPGFGLYIHWPFCEAKCPYCDFNSHVRRSPVEQQEFVSAYLREMETLAAEINENEMNSTAELTSIFFGGGTPSLMEGESVAALLEGAARHWPFAKDIEITLEANPSSVEAARFAAYRAAGVNRVSLGVQALNDEDLRKLGRLHDVSQALSAMEIARDVFERVSFDLIYARMGQGEKAWAAELTRALEFEAGHLSLYQLTIEPGTPFAALHQAGKLSVPDEEQAARLYDLTQEICAAAGLEAYEVSNYARPGQESRHNLLYWRYGAYVGLGAGAHGRIISGGDRIATQNYMLPERWAEAVGAQGTGIERREELSAHAQSDEMLLMGLRLKEGVSLARVEELRGKALDRAALEQLLEAGLLRNIGNEYISVTDEGRLVLNSVIAHLTK